jgi:galactokinase
MEQTLDGDLMLGQAVARFTQEFGGHPTVAAFAPGRVNLIGEHVDYNAGFVLPFALPFRTIVVGSVVRRASSSAANANLSTVISCNIDQPAQFVINRNLKKLDAGPMWANYVIGTAYQYLDYLPADCAFQAVYLSDVPIGSGLSSSASLEVATATLLEELFGLKGSNFSGVSKALRCQKAEHDFAGVPCGIMDQYVSSLGQSGSLLLIDCRSNTFDLVHMGSAAAIDAVESTAARPVMIVCNSNVKHALTGSEYPDRVRQCKEAVSALQRMFPEVQALRDAKLDQLYALRAAEGKDYSTAVPEGTGKKPSTLIAHDSDTRPATAPTAGKASLSEVAYRRAHHCITEDIRTLTAVEALKKGDYVTVGKNMTESHLSLQWDFEVSCDELDTLVTEALNVDGVYGSRMTGGGFGGCTVTLVRADRAKALIQHLKRVYPSCECYEVQPSAGAGILDLRSALEITPSMSRYGDVDDRRSPAASRASLFDFVNGNNTQMAIIAGGAIAATLWFVARRRNK